MDESENNWLQHLVVPALVLFSLLGAILLSYSGPVEELKLNVTDQLFEIRGPISIEDTSVVIVSISQQADQEIPYKYPWPTNLHAKLIEHLNQAGAKAIGFDVLFDKRDNYDLRNDTLFADALKEYQNVILGANIQRTQQYRGRGSSSVSMMLLRPNRVLQKGSPHPPGLVRARRDADASIRKYFLGLRYNNQQFYSMGVELLRLYEEVDSTAITMRPDRF